MRISPLFFVLFGFFLIGVCRIFAVEPNAPGFFQTPVVRSLFDEEGFVEWFDGKEKRIEHHRGISQVLNSQDSTSEYRGVEFGDSKNPGPRYVRIPLKEEISVGTLLVCGIGTPSVLKATVSDPATADPSDDELWISGKRIVDGRLTDSEDGLNDAAYSAWIFPPDTKTRAIRFAHTPRDTDKKYNGWLGGIYVLSERLINVAPYGIAFAASENHHASKLNDRSDNGKWGAWDNGKEGRETPISAKNPEFVSLVWEESVRLQGLCTIWTGFRAADVEIYVGPEDKHPNESIDPADWKRIASRSEIRAGYTQPMYPIWYDFGPEPVSTRAVRLRITEVAKEDHEHIRNNMKDGKRVWLGEILAFTALKDDVDPLAVLPRTVEDDHPPIPIRFSLNEDALVTLVVEKEDGTRVRNLVAETPFLKGENVVYWDGSDDLLRDRDAARHGLYNIPRQIVEPGRYVVRGLSRKPLDLRYEFSVYNEGTPPWPTADNTGGWLTNHTPPGCVLWVPGEQSPTGRSMLYLGSYVSEGGHGLAWFEIDENGKEISVSKKGGVGWIGGNWTGAQFLARDKGKNRIEDHCLYVGSVWGTSSNNHEKGQDGEVRISIIGKNGQTRVFKYTFKPTDDANNEHDWGPNLGGIAVRDGIVVFSLPKLNRLVFMDASNGEVRKTIDWPAPGALTYSLRDELYLLSGDKLYCWKADEKPESPEKSTPLITNLDHPKGIAFDSKRNIYISEQGESHYVRVFGQKGRQLRTIGVKGVPRAGQYNEQKMNRPSGVEVDDAGRLWVTETDFQPKRVGVWTTDGELIRAFYGPAEYGGGGKLDPTDPTKFYYHGMEFRLDWKTGTFELGRVMFRPEKDQLGLPDGWGAGGFPECPLYPNGPNGHRYFTNCFNNNPTGGTPLACLWWEDPKSKTLRPRVAFGSVQNWSIFKREEFKSRLPEGIDLDGDRHRNQCRFLWSDLNADGDMQPDEVRFEIGGVGGVVFGVVENRLAIIATRITDEKENNDKTVARTVLYSDEDPQFHIPKFGFSMGRVLASGVENPRSSGGDQALYDADDKRMVATLGVKPFAPESVVGVRDGKALWSYPNPWPGLHASHESARPTQRGQLIGITRLLGDFVQTSYPRPVFAMNGNQGNIYLMTSDGLFVAELFHDVRLAPTWSMPVAVRNMGVGNLTLHDENFWPSITQTSDGKIFLVDGANSALVRIDGLDTIRKIKPFELEISKADLDAANDWLMESERRRQSATGQPTLRIPIRTPAVGNEIKIDGMLDDWKDADWAVIDRSGTAAYFDSNSKPYDITAALCVSQERLAVAFRTNLKDLLRNSGELPQALFKNGGCLDIMIGADPQADPKRRDPVQGDQRLLVTLVEGKPRAVLYRAVVPGTETPVPFSSPHRTITLDRVDDVSEKLEFAAGENGIFEISVPLALLGLERRSGLKIKGDVGVLRGNGFSTLARVYWSNKATAITSDVPSEAQLTPALWGNWIFE